MKHIFDEKDINCGMFIKRNNTIAIISWNSVEMKGEFGNSDRIVYLSEINTDGLIRPIGTKFCEVAKVLTNEGWLLINNPFAKN